MPDSVATSISINHRRVFTRDDPKFYKCLVLVPGRLLHVEPALSKTGPQADPIPFTITLGFAT